MKVDVKMHISNHRLLYTFLLTLLLLYNYKISLITMFIHNKTFKDQVVICDKFNSMLYKENWANEQTNINSHCLVGIYFVITSVN